MRKERLQGIWDRAAFAFDQFGPRFFAHSGRRLVELTQIPMGSNILDVAAGRGAILFPTARRVGRRGQVIGVDLSIGMVREAASEIRCAGLKHAQVCQMDGERLAFADASFDFVLCGHAIFYFPHAAHEFYRVLKPDILPTAHTCTGSTLPLISTNPRSTRSNSARRLPSAS